ncbi:MAG TPA: GlyGly-CTERM sorting domain-containing protein [Deltaproteobacteria bacterium]|nr:GlyGly-CTERM sorting domain-containing protein [Deltaproteobacteria bacterium]
MIVWDDSAVSCSSVPAGSIGWLSLLGIGLLGYRRR